ncbi:MAG TPA: redox-regulated ATPase YchF [Acidimicrobiia bacterium]|nr:redox-regulated ATPase YchF [Acidimicrobiia bacterium]
MARIGIVGLPNVGKTTLFNALTGLEAPTAAHPFSTTEPNLGVAKVPDADLDEAARVESSAKLVHATLELLDLPAMAKPGHGGGFGAQFLGRLRDMEALAVVLRAFEDDAVPSDESGTDPVAQAQELLLELALADFDVFERRREKIVKEATADAGKKGAAEAITRATALLEQGRQLRAERWERDQLSAFRDLAPLTLKPAVWVVNVDEDTGEVAGLVGELEALVPDGDTVVVVSAELEEEGALLPPEDRRELFEGLGLGEGALAKVVRAAYAAMDLISFYTLGPKEAHAWTVRKGAKAPEAAGKIHSDLERGFIRAEVAPIPDVIADGGWDESKKAGHVRVEGKDYTVAEGDVIVVRFSV